MCGRVNFGVDKWLFWTTRPQYECLKILSERPEIPPPNGKLQIWDDQSLLRNTPPPLRQAWNPGDRMWRLICIPRGYHSFTWSRYTSTGARDRDAQRTSMLWLHSYYTFFETRNPILSCAKDRTGCSSRNLRRGSPIQGVGGGTDANIRFCKLFEPTAWNRERCGSRSVGGGDWAFCSNKNSKQINSCHS